MKRAFIILGPESSGTRLLTQLFIKAGCAGDPGHTQRLDKEKPVEPLVVIRRSYPYRKQWPNLAKLSGRLQSAGYDVFVIVIIRSLQFTVLSALNQKHTASMEKAQHRSLEGFKQIGAALFASKLPFVWVTYEALVQWPEQTTRWLFDQAGLKPPPEIEIYDGNRKYV